MGTGGDGAINDGVSSAIKATVFDYTNSNPLGVVLRDTNGDYVSVGGGTQYNQGTAATDTDVLTMMGCVRADTAAVATGVIAGDRARCIIDSTGRLWTFAAQSGTWTVAQSGTWNIGTVTTLTGITNPVAVTGTFWQATQPISGTVTVTDGAGALNVICDSGCGSGTQYAEDTAHVSGDQLSMAGVVQQTADAALAGDGDRTALQVDANGYLKVNIKAGAGSGGTASTDNSAFTGGSTNVTPMGAVYDTTPPAITDGNVGAPRMDSNRYLYVDCVVGCSGGATTPSDNFANPTDAGNSAAFNFVWDGTTWDRAPGTSTDGLLVNLGANNDVTVTGTVTVTDGAGALNVIVDSSALPTGASTLAEQQTQTTALQLIDNLVLGQGAATAGQSGVLAQGAVTTAAPTYTTGNTNPLSLTTAGALRVDGSGSTQPVSGTVSITTNSAVNVAQINGVAPSMGNGISGTGVQRVTLASDSTGQVAIASLPNEGQQTMGNSVSVAIASDQSNVPVSQATAASLNMRPDTSGATGAAPPARANYVGGLASGATGGFLSGFAVCDSFANVNVSTATTTLLVTGVSGRHVRICSLSLVTAAANNVALISGTGATCATGTTGMTGGTTAATGFNFAANGGITQGNGLGTINQTNATGDSVCIVTSAATQLSGRIAYAIY